MAEDSVTGEREFVVLAGQLAGEIRKRRRAAGLSQPRLAERIGYTPQYVSRAERRKGVLASAELVAAIERRWVKPRRARVLRLARDLDTVLVSRYPALSCVCDFHEQYCFVGEPADAV